MGSGGSRPGAVGISPESQNLAVAQWPPPMALGSFGGARPARVCASVHLGGPDEPIPVCGHLQAEGHLEVLQLPSTFQDPGNLAPQALLLLLQGIHHQLQNKGRQPVKGRPPTN